MDRTICGHDAPKLYSFGYYLLSLMCAAFATLSAAPLDTGAGNCELLSAPINAIGIASLQKSSDVALATSPVMHPLDATTLDPKWQALVNQMHSVERVAAPFFESRTFTFRKEPKVYRGVFRKEADGRISLSYTEPEAVALHLGEGFAYYRKGEGRVRSIPNSNPRSGALALFPQLLNFDLAGIAESYSISGDIEGELWHLEFVARTDLNDDLPYQSMQVEGRGTAVQRIELTKSKKQRIVIEMGDPVYPEFYLPEIKAQSFFRLDSEE